MKKNNLILLTISSMFLLIGIVLNQKNILSSRTIIDVFYVSSLIINITILIKHKKNEPKE
jgi:hypothetical protein